MSRQRVESCYGGPPHGVFLEYPSGQAQFGRDRFTNAFGPNGTLPPPQWPLTIGMTIPEAIAILGQPTRWVDANYVVGGNSYFFWFAEDKLVQKDRPPLPPVD